MCSDGDSVVTDETWRWMDYVSKGRNCVKPIMMSGMGLMPCKAVIVERSSFGYGKLGYSGRVDPSTTTKV